MGDGSPTEMGDFDMTRTQSWTFNDEGTVAWHATDDPRVLAVILLDEDADVPEGDALAPAYWVAPHGSRGWRWNRLDTTFDDNEVADAYCHALERTLSHCFDRETFIRRYMRAFWSTTFEVIATRDDDLILFNSPAFREYVGLDPDDPATCSIDGEVAEFRAWLNGDAWGIGYATHEGRVLAVTSN